MLDGISGHSLFWGKSGYVGCRRGVCSGSQIAPAYGLRDLRAGTEKRKDAEEQVEYFLKADTCGKPRFRKEYPRR